MIEKIVTLLLAIIISVAGAIAYVHNTFATVKEVESVEEDVSVVKNAVLRSDKLICKMAIRQKLDDAEDICTEQFNVKR